ncbi:hypothetical protein TNCV_4012901 [Trichonephila clavipes]|nr:hypothetical protein TNCV_4012901 [Trichonephila clavipes]
MSKAFSNTDKVKVLLLHSKAFGMILWIAVHRKDRTVERLIYTSGAINDLVQRLEATPSKPQSSVNGDRYRAMITNFFIPELNNHDVQELWFQEDGATCHTARATIDLLKDTFGGHLISSFGPVID